MNENVIAAFIRRGLIYSRLPDDPSHDSFDLWASSQLNAQSPSLFFFFSTNNSLHPYWFPGRFQRLSLLRAKKRTLYMEREIMKTKAPLRSLSHLFSQKKLFWLRDTGNKLWNDRASSRLVNKTDQRRSSRKKLSVLQRLLLFPGARISENKPMLSIDTNWKTWKRLRIRWERCKLVLIEVRNETTHHGVVTGTIQKISHFRRFYTHHW